MVNGDGWRHSLQLPLDAVPGKVSSAEEAAALKGLNAAAEEACDEVGVEVDDFDNTAAPRKQLQKIESVPQVLWVFLRVTCKMFVEIYPSLIPSPVFFCRSFHLKAVRRATEAREITLKPLKEERFLFWITDDVDG